jgi:hypothetical protein
MSKVIATSIERMAADISAYNEQLTAVSNAYKDVWEAVRALNATCTDRPMTHWKRSLWQTNW